MNVVIVEDEVPAYENLAFLLNNIASDIHIVKVLDKVSSAIQFFNSPESDYDLVFMDIHLGDGLSFEIFDQAQLNAPIIFTTAYDQYALKAFKVNSIDYLLKPILEDELRFAMDKFKSSQKSILKKQLVNELILDLRKKNHTYKSTFLVYKKDALIPVKTADFAYFNIDLGIINGTTFDSNTYIINGTMDELEHELNPDIFYRANRQFIIQRLSVQKINLSFNGKLSIETRPKCDHEIIISKAKAKEFKLWMSNT